MTPVWRFLFRPKESISDCGLSERPKGKGHGFFSDVDSKAIPHTTEDAENLREAC